MRKGTLVLLAALLSASVFAQQRTWIKRTIDVIGNDGTQAALFTLIATNDDTDPTLMRFLFGEGPGGGSLLVVRYQIDSSLLSSSTFSYECLATNETLDVTLTPGTPNTILVEFGQESVNFNEDDRSTRPVRGQIAALSLSTECRDVLAQMTYVGLNHGDYLAAAATFLHDVMFPEYGTPDSRTRVVKDKTVVDFDPQTTLPDSFETLFGAAYYQ